MPDPPDIHGIDRDVSHIAGIHGRVQLRHMVFTDRKSAGKQDQRFSSREGAQVPRQNLQGQKGIASDEIRTGATRSRAICTWVIACRVIAEKTTATLSR